LKASLETPEVLNASRKVAEAHRVSKVAKSAGRQRESVYRMLSEEGNPRLDSLWAVLHVMGLRINVEGVPEKKHRAFPWPQIVSLQADTSKRAVARRKAHAGRRQPGTP
jgi:probable addiction module antidote protein